MARWILCLLIVLGPTTVNATETLRVGQAAPAFSLLDLYGRTISLDYFDRHPAAILFWSPSSPASLELLGDFGEYQDNWGTNDLAIVAVGLEEGGSGTDWPAAARAVAEQQEILFPVLLDPGGATAAAYRVTQIPTAVVVDAAGRVSAVLTGHQSLVREKLSGSLLLAMGREADDSTQRTAARGAGEAPAADSPRALASSCSIPRARSCSRIHDRDPSASDAAVMAVRLCNCYGDVEAARVMLAGVGPERLQGLDLRFALAHLMLLKGKPADARRAFESLREAHPQESWGEWGLSLVALAEGRTDEALSHLRKARAGGWSIPEAETAVMKYLEPFWRSNRQAPGEEQFLALFEELGSVRACYRRLSQKG